MVSEAALAYVGKKTEGSRNPPFLENTYHGYHGNLAVSEDGMMETTFSTYHQNECPLKQLYRRGEL